MTFHTHTSAGLNKRAVTRINSMPNMGSNTLRQRGSHPGEAVIQRPDASQAPLEVGSIVEVESTSGIMLYGVVRWLGIPKGKTTQWAGIELVRSAPALPAFPTQRLPLKPGLDLSVQDYDVRGCSDGTYGDQRYFSCKGNRALFVPSSKCSPDSRLGHYDKPAAASPGWKPAYEI